MQRRVDWAGPVLETIESERAPALPRDDLVKRQAWRDRRLMALAAHKRRAATGNRRVSEELKPMAVNGKVIITCAVTGAIHTPTMSPYLPITPEEITGEAIAAAEAGAAILHLHARDPGDRQARPDAGGLRPLPAAHQAGAPTR